MKTEQDLEKCDRRISRLLDVILLLLIVVFCWSLSGCSASWHLRQAVKKDPSLLTGKIDSVPVLIKGAKSEIVFNFPRSVTVVKGETKEKIKYKYVRIPNTDSIEAEIECPDSVVYKIKETHVYEIPPSYKAFVKQLMKWNNLQFWIAHTILAITVLGYIGYRLRKFIPGL
jgi:hypothetical protein